MNLDEPINAIKGIGKVKEKHLKRIGINVLQDLLEYYPRDYEDRSKTQMASSAFHGSKVLLKGTIVSPVNIKRVRKNLAIIKTTAKDESGVFDVAWYNTPYIKNNIHIGETYFFYGKVNNSYGKVQLEAPEYAAIENKNFLGILPIYPLTKGLIQKDIRNSLKLLLDGISIKDYLPRNIIQSLDLLSLEEAYSKIHFPKDYNELLLAKERLILNEFIEIQLAFNSMREELSSDYLPFKIDVKIKEKIDNLIHILPFKLTSSQEKVLEEICEDFTGTVQMNRLVQGDVGSGKTIIAVIALYIAFLNDYQGVLMVPTEILAEQHYDYMVDLFNSLNLNINMGLMTKFKSKKVRLECLSKVASGEYDIVVATHGVIEDDVRFSHLGLVITDEQHRFGVKQRKQLTNKGKIPHIIVMSATPIPRTISLSLYGDLDISTIDVLPSGRKAIKTYCVNTSYRDRIHHFILKEISAGRQAYILCPSIEANDKLASVEEMIKDLQKGPLKTIPIGMLHGKMKSEEKEEAMRSFYENKTKLLICTTVVEVGINVPNAAIMVIENSERFGLNQLHQLRGRVGRGFYQSYCILITDNKSKKTSERMKVLVESTDGFYIAQRDLDLRGPGDYFGFHQHGLPSFKLADLSKHSHLLKKANEVVEEMTSLKEYNNIKREILEVFYHKINQVSMN